MSVRGSTIQPLEAREATFRDWIPRRTTEPSRYTTDKFVAYLTYAERTGRWRHVAVIISSPLPALALSLLAPIIPLEDPRLGARANASFFMSFFVTFTIVALGSSLQIRATCGFTRHDYSHTDVLLIAVLEGILSTAAVAATAFLWRFPVPFVFAVLFAPILVSFFTAHVAVLRGRLLRRDSVLRGPILAFLPSFAAQSFQVVVYPALSTAFAASNEIGQITLVVVFPFIKYGMRFILRHLTQHLTENGNESAVNSIEIAASTYQSMLMQTASSPYATALLIAIDIAQSFISVFIFMPKTASVGRSEILTRATKLVRESMPMQHTQSVVPMAWTATSAPARVAPQESIQPAAVGLADLNAVSVISQALALLHAAESIVFIEYLEVALPMVNAVFVSVVSQLQSAEYSPRLRDYRHRPDELQQALANLGIYTVLQALSVFILHGVLRRRYRLDTTVLLAFLLERHAWAVQAKLIAWLGVMFQMPVLHYGFDFTFRFDFTPPPLE